MIFSTLTNMHGSCGTGQQIEQRYIAAHFIDSTLMYVAVSVLLDNLQGLNPIWLYLMTNYYLHQLLYKLKLTEV